MNTFAEALASSGFKTLDFIILCVYVILIVSIGMFLLRNKSELEKSASSYFLANNTLTWWAVGASILAANISTEQFIGLSGTSFANGIATAAYEIMVALVLVFIGKFLLPILMERKTFTIPQFLRERYNDGVGLAFSILWLFLYIFVNLTSVAWLGSLAIEQIFNVQGLEFDLGFMNVSVRSCIVFFVFVIAGLYSTYGGQANVAWTDVLQTTFIIGGGLITTWSMVQVIANNFGMTGFELISNIYDEMTVESIDTGHLHLILQESHNPEAYDNMPGVAAIVGAVLLTNLSYWGFNQYIIQKGLAAQNIEEARKGLIFAGMLKLLIPVIVVLPGICAYYVYTLHPETVATLGLEGTIEKPDYAYAWLVRHFTPSGFKGLALVALTASIISSLASMVNSASAIFTMDIYKKHLNPGANDQTLVTTGRFVSLGALIIAFAASHPLFGSLDQAFNFIQENSMLFYPGIIVVCGFGLFWKRASTTAAVWTALITIPLGILMRHFFGHMPFISRASLVFIIEAIFFIVISLCSHKTQNAELQKAEDRRTMLRWAYILGGTGLGFILLTAIVMLMGNTTQLTAYLNDIGFQAFIFFGALVSCGGLVLYNNSLDSKADPKAMPINLSLFRTTRGYTYGFLAVLFFTLLYYVVLW
ncbi:MAG: sodium/solute symporter [Bacteroidaceae bacterium]|nr:sodium/solute symporter [Bacteroidaceae bacterium]